MSLLQDAKSQYIDDNGKARMLKYEFEKKKVSLMISPVAPLSLPNKRKIAIAPLKTALNFIKKYNLKILSQEKIAETDEIKGLWVKVPEDDLSIYYSYIPIEPAESIKNYPFSEPTKLDPLSIKGTSKLQEYRKSRKIAEFLKIYTLYTYALNPEDFDESWFVVDPEHDYDIEKLNKKLTKNNSVMYNSGGYLIVPTQETITRLMSYLDIQLLTDKPGIMSLANVKTIEKYYQSVSDFKPADNQLIFTSSDSVKRWKKEAEKIEGIFTVSQNLIPRSIEPYFYRTPKISNNRLHIIQNIRSGSPEDAAIVSYKWIKDKINLGYFPVDRIAFPDDIPYKAYTNNGLLLKHGKETKNETMASLIFYEETESYGAILFLE